MMRGERARAEAEPLGGVTVDWGLVPYGEALERQLALVEARLAGTGRDLLVLTEHPPVFTLGVRQAAAEHLRWSEGERTAAGVELHPTRRGGDVTCHAPGQLVGYPIVSLAEKRDLHGYLRLLEDVLIAVLAELGLIAGRRAGLTGVWVGSRKVAAIGVAVRRWVAYHGFALNVTNDLSYFSGIVPCGITAEQGTVTSLAAEGALPGVNPGHGIPQSLKDLVVTTFWQRWAAWHLPNDGETL